MLLALSLPNFQPQIPPLPKCRLSAPRSRAARNAQLCRPRENCAPLKACRAWLRDEQSELFTWSRQRRPSCPAPSERLVSLVEPRCNAGGPAKAKPKAIQALGRCSLQGGIRFCSEAYLSFSVPFGAGSRASVSLSQLPDWAPGSGRECGSNPRAACAAPAFQPLTPDPGPTLYKGRASPPLTHTHKSLHPKVRKPSTPQHAGH